MAAYPKPIPTGIPASAWVVPNTNGEVWIDDGADYGEQVIFYVLQKALGKYKVVFKQSQIFNQSSSTLNQTANPFTREKGQAGHQTSYMVVKAAAPNTAVTEGIWIPPKNV